MSRVPNPRRTLTREIRALKKGARLQSGASAFAGTGIAPTDSGGFVLPNGSLQTSWMTGAVVPWLEDQTFQLSGQTVPQATYSFPISVTSLPPESGTFSKVLITATAQAGCNNTTASLDYLFATPTISGYGFPGFATPVVAGGYNTAVTTYNLLLGNVSSVELKAGIRTSLAPWTGVDLTVRLAATLLWIR